MLATLTHLLAYIAIPTVVGVTSYIAGFETCVITHHQHGNLGAALMARRPSSDTPPADDAPVDVDLVRRRKIGGLDLGVVGYLLAALALVVAGFTAYQGQANERSLITCLNTYANQSADALDARQKPNKERNAAITYAFEQVSRAFHGKADRADVQRAIDAYLAADARLLHKQEVNPLPEPPRAVCP